ncbi:MULTISPECIES: hypothetical protein [unclassified Paenibacillus]|uniref:hypothetical protein n=1 Tax=unclassified Paenibacillus TaxID=185978 RepID=UPI001AE997ED|nr:MULTISPECIES: hypothetical protein [unclassified Paenibacillus]MBP1157688.1 hypothetical protein [Paenibacillus sp. PvP091]MBP1171575.1 hypothetical protein [Paenibacillus sp. PvR098]MBP2437956.1 hypothetical protein [Paenibacillus sp. PvP052]
MENIVKLIEENVCLLTGIAVTVSASVPMSNSIAARLGRHLGGAFVGKKTQDEFVELEFKPWDGDYILYHDELLQYEEAFRKKACEWLKLDTSSVRAKCRVSVTDEKREECI